MRPPGVLVRGQYWRDVSSHGLIDVYIRCTHDVSSPNGHDVFSNVHT